MPITLTALGRDRITGKTVYGVVEQTVDAIEQVIAAPAGVDEMVQTPADKKEAARIRKAKSRAANPDRNREVNIASLARYRATHPDRNKKHVNVTPATEAALVEAVEIIHAVVSGFTPSSYQQAIFDWIVSGQGNAIVGAVAGSGKTTTLVQIARLLTEPAVFFAFNAHIVRELTGRLTGTSMVAKTIHSYGNGVLYASLGVKPDVEHGKYKYSDLIKAAVFQIAPYDPAKQQIAREALKKLVDFCRLTLTDPRDAAAMASMMMHYDIFIPDAFLEAQCIQSTAAILAEGVRIAQDSGLIDFTDMVWLPIRLDLPCPRTPWVLIDECQDLNGCQTELVLRACSGRAIAVGDAHQSMYGFAGADSDSFNKIRARLDAQYFPLSICYRCPSSHIARAQQIVPEIEAAPNAPAGILEYLPEAQATALLERGDMVLCRLTAPLIKLCIELIQRKIPARVKGRDIAKMLVDIVKAVYIMPGYAWEQFNSYLDYYENEQVSRLAQRQHSESAIESLQDRVAAVRTCYEAWQCESAATLIHEIEALFSDEESYITLSTVHRAKGLECDRVFLLQPQKMPLTWPKQQDWEYEQELNIQYVAYTRAKTALYFMS